MKISTSFSDKRYLKAVCRHCHNFLCKDRPASLSDNEVQWLKKNYVNFIKPAKNLVTKTQTPAPRRFWQQIPLAVSTYPDSMWAAVCPRNIDLKRRFVTSLPFHEIKLFAPWEHCCCCFCWVASTQRRLLLTTPSSEKVSFSKQTLLTCFTVPSVSPSLILPIDSKILVCMEGSTGKVKECPEVTIDVQGRSEQSKDLHLWLNLEIFVRLFVTHSCGAINCDLVPF